MEYDSWRKGVTRILCVLWIIGMFSAMIVYSIVMFPVIVYRLVKGTFWQGGIDEGE